MTITLDEAINAAAAEILDKLRGGIVYSRRHLLLDVEYPEYHKVVRIMRRTIAAAIHAAVEAEREACAKVAEAPRPRAIQDHRDVWIASIADVAAAIRARKEAP